MRKLAVSLLVVSLLAVGTPLIEGLSYSIVMENDSIHLEAEITVNINLEQIYNTIVSRIENLGIPTENIPSLDQVSDTVENNLETVENLRRDYSSEINDAIGEICENKIRTYVSGVDVENAYLNFEVTRDGYVFTINTGVGLDLKGDNLFRSTSEGRRRVDLRWRAFALNQAKNVGGKLFDSKWAFVNLSGFQTPLDQWQKRDENDRIVLSYTTDYEVDLPEYNVAISVDPTAVFIGPSGSAGASVTGDEIILAVPTQPVAFLPPVWVAATAGLILLLAVLLVIWKYVSVKPGQKAALQAVARVFSLRAARR